MGELDVDRIAAALQEVPGHLADAEDVALLKALHVLHGQVHHVAVVAAGKALVRRDDDVRGAVSLRRLQVAVRLALRVHQDVLDGLAHFFEVDGVGVIARQTLFHLGGGDHLHGLCDLQRLRDHAHVVADIGYARHVLLTS